MHLLVGKYHASPTIQHLEQTNQLMRELLANMDGSSEGGKGGPRKGGARTTGLAQSRLPSKQPVGWRELLFKCILALCRKQMEYLQRTRWLDKKDAPFILIVCPLARGAPLLRSLARASRSRIAECDIPRKENV